MGKTVIRASDGPGFLVNRCNRPFGLEALRLLQERIADIETIDRICRMEGGFRMGPFELMDLVGVDTGFEVSKSFYEQSFGEPRWRPSPIAARYVAAGLHGRKSGRGYYDYARRRAPATAPDGPRAARRRARRARRGRRRDRRRAARSPDELRAAARGAGYEVRSPHDADRRRAAGAVRSTANRSARERGASRGTAAERSRGGRLRAARACCCARADRWARSTPAAAPSASTCCRRSPRRGSSS